MDGSLIYRPRHYQGKSLIGDAPIEVIDLQEVLCGYAGHMAQAIGYLARHHRKDTPKEDLQSALYYINRMHSHARPLRRDLPAIVSTYITADRWQREFDVPWGIAEALHQLGIACAAEDAGPFQLVLERAAAHIIVELAQYEAPPCG